VLSRAQRWVELLGPPSLISQSFWAQGIGFLFTNLFPLRLGEPARVLIMAERSVMPIAQVTATALVERLLDVATMVFLLVVVLFWLPVPEAIIRAGITLGAIGLLGIALLFAAVRYYEHSEQLLQFIELRLRLRLPFVGGLTSRWREMVTGFSRFTQPGTALRVIGWSLVSWGCSLGVYWCVIRAFQREGTLLEATFMMVSLGFAVAVPSSPGFIGVFQYVGQQALVVPFGQKYSLSSAFAITVTAHLTYYLFTTLLGIVGLWQLDLSLNRLLCAVRRVNPRLKLT
jgi:uncharacterized protein (TIRG00374 family)